MSVTVTVAVTVGVTDPVGEALAVGVGGSSPKPTASAYTLTTTPTNMTTAATKPTAASQRGMPHKVCGNTNLGHASGSFRFSADAAATGTKVTDNDPQREQRKQQQ